jgi:uncharacterized SAM-binding protein YcdF (DUF218 family)
MGNETWLAKGNNSYFKSLFLSVIKYVKCFLGILGLFSLLILVLSFTDLPYSAYYCLGTKKTKLDRPPDIIVILSGSGMPSPDGLIRAFYGVQAARKFPLAKIIIAIPYSIEDSLRPLKLMAHQLIIEGIDSTRIQFEAHGFNTRSQAVNIAAMFPGNKEKLPLVIITSPEHMYRAVRTFIKVGFRIVGGIPAFDRPIDEEKAEDKDKARDIRVRSLSLRYNMWSYLHLELLVIKEYCAIAYYKFKGWI